LVVVVKLGDHVTYYSIHDVAVSFMEIGVKYLGIEGAECDFDP
jgi:hypothetical protein